MLEGRRSHRRRRVRGSFRCHGEPTPCAFAMRLACSAVIAAVAPIPTSSSKGRHTTTAPDLADDDEHEGHQEHQRADHEELWREDHLYDLVVVLDYNLAMPRRGAGSAIFLHLAAPGFTPTAGCIAITKSAMLRLLTQCGPATRLVTRA